MGDKEDLGRCAYPGCERKAEFLCVVCRQYFCAFHTYEQSGYVCKDDFVEPTFKDYPPYTEPQPFKIMLKKLFQFIEDRF